MVGGKVVEAAGHPGVVQVVVNDLEGGRETICGGALIAPRVVVTAGHCFLNVPLRRLRPVSVVSGRQWAYPHTDPPAGIHIGVLEVLHAPIDKRIHEPYPDDVELLRLRRPAPFAPLRLGTPAEVRAGTPARVLGWGLTRERASESAPRQLRGLTMRVRSDAVCGRVANGEYHASTQLCLTPRSPAHAEGTCYGDSGTPLLGADGNTVLGMVSTSNGVCGRAASIYSRLTSGPLRHWVERQVRAWESSRRS
ncbi:MAG TPA: trypsin-like serine protease [Solirubrobacterales bacterium]